jgi:hypothetical protein
MKNLEDYVRVTEVLSHFSGIKNIPPQILQNAAERGTRVHEICDAIINDMGAFDVSENLRGYIDSFNYFLNGKRFIEKPERFFCDKYKISGECDGIYEEDKNLVLVDFKTSSKENKTWRLQGSAYSYLAKLYGYKISRIEFVKLCSEGSSPKIFVYQEDFETFLKCLDVYNLFFKNNKPT